MTDNPADNVGVITKVVHTVMDEIGVEHPDLTEAVKKRCATLGVAYNSGVVCGAIDSAKWQREHARAVVRR